MASEVVPDQLGRQISVCLDPVGSFCNFCVRIDLASPFSCAQLIERAHHAFRVRPPHLRLMLEGADLDCDSALTDALASCEGRGERLLLAAELRLGLPTPPGRLPAGKKRAPAGTVATLTSKRRQGAGVRIKPPQADLGRTLSGCTAAAKRRRGSEPAPASGDDRDTSDDDTDDVKEKDDNDDDGGEFTPSESAVSSSSSSTSSSSSDSESEASGEFPS
jgi:hypothetical protein